MKERIILCEMVMWFISTLEIDFFTVIPMRPSVATKYSWGENRDPCPNKYSTRKDPDFHRDDSEREGEVN